jgi:ATP-binding cassette subfamily B (MDR/TAP) protein 1
MPFIFFIGSWQPLFSSYSAYALKVVSFHGEKQAITTYNKFIRKAYESARREGAVSGLGVGSVMGILFCSYGLAVWYGSKLIVDRGYNGGLVINIMMAVMVGAM